uniref:Uncharacterized protein n=1 Tax=Palpitomonas bilix TaxID=652834 RepID=A0A7S3DIR8_9EUKA|mmetsp:Transcript_37490/g.96816  ORF Transcript_37490/g.96816 Transcript_37490/m.96816 type:complete len:197 (+) Transcript_37490:176-766(+)
MCVHLVASIQPTQHGGDQMVKVWSEQLNGKGEAEWKSTHCLATPSAVERVAFASSSCRAFADRSVNRGEGKEEGSEDEGRMSENEKEEERDGGKLKEVDILAASCESGEVKVWHCYSYLSPPSFSEGQVLKQQGKGSVTGLSFARLPNDLRYILATADSTGTVCMWKGDAPPSSSPLPSPPPPPHSSLFSALPFAK